MCRAGRTRDTGSGGLRPGLGALSIIVALDVWNAFLFPLVLLNSSELFTVLLLLFVFGRQKRRNRDNEVTPSSPSG